MQSKVLKVTAKTEIANVIAQETGVHPYYTYAGMSEFNLKGRNKLIFMRYIKGKYTLGQATMNGKTFTMVQ